MAPSSSDALTTELSNGAMDFQQGSFASDVQFGEPSRQQQQQHQLPLQQPQAQAQAQTSSQPFRPDSYLSSHQPQHAFVAETSQQPQQHHPSQLQRQHRSSAQQQQPSGDSYPPQHAFAGDMSSPRQPAPNGEQQQHPHHAQHDSFASMTSPLPPASVSGSSSQAQAAHQPNDPNAQAAGDPQFDIFEWYPKYQSCQRYFADHAQQSSHVQAVAAFVNIALPFQRALNPIHGSPPRLSPSLASPPTPPPYQTPTCISLLPYLRRLVVTGLDFPGVLHGFFGDDWVAGVGPLHEQERRNYLFAAKSGGWASVKKDYDMPPLETVPFMRPLHGPVIAEIEAAEKSWSEWLAMEDWMVGPRAPENMRHGQSGHERDQGRR